LIEKHSLRFLEEAMKYREIVELVAKASERIWHKLPDVTSFEHTCYRNIGEELLKGGVKSVRKMAKYYIRRAEARHIKETQYQHHESLEALARYDDYSNEGFEPVDVLADVEGEALANMSAKEKVTLLAQDDNRQKKILKAWLKGDSDTEISRSLARSLGGNESGHRSYIKRFKKTCQQRLTSVV